MNATSRRYRQLLLTLPCTLLSSCLYTFSVGERTFSTAAEALAYQRSSAQTQLDAISRGSYHGGSLLLTLPSDPQLGSRPFITNPNAAPIVKDYLIRFYHNDAELLTEAIRRSGIFDSVTLKQLQQSELKYAADFGYNFVIRYEGTGFTFFDIGSGKRHPLGSPGSLENFVYLIESALGRVEPVSQASRKEDLDVNIEEMEYNEKTKRGWVSVRGKGLNARNELIKRINEICSSKNVVLIGGRTVGSAAFRILDEQLKDGILKIEFEAIH